MILANKSQNSRNINHISVNMQNALQISEQQSSDFAGSLPEGFHKTIPKRVKTMEVMKKAVTVEEADITLINYCTCCKLLEQGHPPYAS